MNIENDRFPDDLKPIQVFEIKAIEAIKDNIYIKNWAKAFQKNYLKIRPILQGEEFRSDLNTIFSIMKKYRTKGIEVPLLIGCYNMGDRIGKIIINNKIVPIDERDFGSEEGVTIIMRIYDLLGLDFGCKECLVRAPCQKLNPDIDCDKILEITDGFDLSYVARTILSCVCVLIDHPEVEFSDPCF